MAARRVAAGVLVVLAATAALRSDPDGDRTEIVVAARDLAPGVSSVVGATLAGPARRGEIITDVRLLGPRLAESAAGPNARIVPLHLADTALLDLIRAGDVVDVLAATTSDTGADARPRVIATDAVVVLVSEKQKGAGTGIDRVVLVALPAHAANEVAGAALVQTVTLTFH